MKKLFLAIMLSLLLPMSGLAADGNRVIEGRMADSVSTAGLDLDQNVEALSTAKTLVVTDKVIQKLDPNGADRDVTLPAEGSSTDLVFWIYNSANGSGEDLTVKDDTPTTIVTLGPGMGMMFSCNGTSWVAMDNEGLVYDAQAGTVTTDKVILSNTSKPALSISQTSISGTDNQAIDITGGEALDASEHWTGIRIKPDDLDPGGDDTQIRGLAINLSGVDITNPPESINGLRLSMPSGLTGLARQSMDAIHIEQGDIDHNFSVPSTTGAHFTAYDFIVDASSLNANSEIHVIDVTATGGTPAGDLSALATHTNVAPIHQTIGSYSSPNQNVYAGRKTGGGSTWADGIDTEEIFVANSDEVCIGAAAQFSEIEVIMTTGASENMNLTYWYNTAADSWTQFYPSSSVEGFQQSGLIYWALDDISGSWTGDGDPGAGETTAGYWIKIIRDYVPDPGTPTPTTMKTSVVTTYAWDENGDISVGGLEVVEGQVTISPVDQWENPLEITEEAGGDTAFKVGVSGASENTFSIYNNNNPAVTVNGNGDSYFNGGDIGIGTSDPDSLLELSKDSADTELTVSTYHDTEATSSTVTTRKSDGTEGSEALVDDNAVLGTWKFKGYDGNSWAGGAYIQARVDGTPGDGDLPTEVVFATSADGSESPTERVVVGPDGSSTFSPDGTNETFQVNDGTLDFTDGASGTTGTLTVASDGDLSYNKNITASNLPAGVYAGSGTYGSTGGVVISIGSTLSGTTYRVTLASTSAAPISVGAVSVESKSTTQFTVKNSGSDNSSTFDWILVDKN